MENLEGREEAAGWGSQNQAWPQDPVSLVLWGGGWV